MVYEENDSNNEAKKEEVEWKTMARRHKNFYIIRSIIKIILFIILLYFFLLSLNFMTIGFTLVSGVALKGGEAIRFILSNPFAALAIGIIVTAIMQNATATTSIAVSMVGAGIIPDVKNAIPIIMGSNIGTCFTNSLIALTLANDPNEFKRAFSAATLNDMFNFLTTAVLLPIEILTNFLFVVSEKLTNAIPFENAEQIAKANFIGAILNPFTDAFIRLNNTAIDALTNGNSNITEIALRCCDERVLLENQTTLVNITNLETNQTETKNVTISTNVTKCFSQCNYLCMPMLKGLGDAGTGLFWIIFSILVLIACLFGIVKVLSLLIVGPIAKGVRKGLNASLPGRMKWFTQVILFVIALLLTLIVQSSNIITATLVPLCGIGLISLQRVYVMTLGSNIGTTVTGILSAFTLTPSAMKKGLQLAFVYTFFNTLGVVFWLPIPILKFPKLLARNLGNIVFEYRWFLYVYIFSVYYIIPLIIFGLALVPHWIGLAIFGIPIISFFLFYLIILLLRKFLPSFLSPSLMRFDWLPIGLRSLGPYDRFIKKHSCFPCFKKRNKINSSDFSSPQPIQNFLSSLSYEMKPNMLFPSIIRRFSTIPNLVPECMIESSPQNMSNQELKEETIIPTVSQLVIIPEEHESSCSVSSAFQKSPLNL